MKKRMCPSRRSSAIKILVTVYLSTSYLNKCQFHRTKTCGDLVRRPTIGSKRIQFARWSNRDHTGDNSAGVNRPVLLCAATPSRRLVPRLMCLDQPLAGCFGADAWQAMHGATPGSEISNEVCANCQIRTTTLKMQSTKTRISSAVLPFSCERTNSL
jgi:hypothetical protein